MRADNPQSDVMTCRYRGRWLGARAVRGEGVLTRGVPHDDAWRTEGEQVLNLLGVFMNRVKRLYKTMIQPTHKISAAEVRADMQVIGPAQHQCEAALNDWVERWAEVLAKTGKGDPSRGGFDVLTIALEDGYHGACLAHVALLGLSFSAGRIAAEGLTEKVEEAYDLAVKLYDEAALFARVVTDNVKTPTSQLNREMYSIYRERVPEEARAAYGDLYQYLDDLNRLPIH